MDGLRHAPGTNHFHCVCGRVVTFARNSKTYPTMANLTFPGRGMISGDCPFCGAKHWRGRPKNIQQLIDEASGELAPQTTADLIYRQQIDRVAGALGWKPRTLQRRIDAALPSPVEQQIYLAVVGDLNLRPESMAKLMRKYMQAGSLRAEDLSPSPTPRFKSFVEYLAAVLELLRLSVRDYPNLSLAVDTAAEIVLTYGTDPDAIDTFLSMVELNLPRLRWRCGLSESAGYATAMNRGIWYMLKFVIPARRRTGRTDPLSLDEGEVHMPEETELDYHSLRNTRTGRKLKDYGIDL